MKKEYFHSAFQIQYDMGLALAITWFSNFSRFG